MPPLSALPAPAVVEGEVRRSADEVRERALRLASGLRARGVEPGDVVAFRFPPGEDALLAYLGCWASGAAAAPVHHRCGDAEARDLLRRLSPRLVLEDAGALLAPSPAEPVRVDGAATAVLLATSGSSGRPKIVRHTHRALAYKARVMTSVHGLTPDDVVLMPAPMAHISGLLNGVLLPAWSGMRVVFMPRWSGEAAAELVERERVTFMIGPPTYFVQMARCAVPVRSLRLVSCGGAGVNAGFARRASARFGCVVKRTYGSTEAPTVTTSYAGDPVELGWTTDGRPVGEVEVGLDGATGELLVRGPELFEGYDDPAQTAAAVDAEGWFRTGDRARLDGDWLVVLGRLRDTIIRGGENVDPAEVESVCEGLPGTRQAVVVGYPDDEMGERVGLVVVADAAPRIDAVRAHCAAAGLARFKMPERVVAVDELPVRTVGKPDRAALRDLLSSSIPLSPCP